MPSPFSPRISLAPRGLEKLESLSPAISQTPVGGPANTYLFRRPLSWRNHLSNVQISGEALLRSLQNRVIWRNRYAEQGLPGLQDAPRSGRPPVKFGWADLRRPFLLDSANTVSARPRVFGHTLEP